MPPQHHRSTKLCPCECQVWDWPFHYTESGWKQTQKGTIKTSNQINVPVLVCFGGQARALIQKLDPDYPWNRNATARFWSSFPPRMIPPHTSAPHYGVAAAASAAVPVGVTAAAAAAAVAVAITVAWGVGGVGAAVVGVRGGRWLDQILGRFWCFKALNLMVHPRSLT